VDVLNPSYLVAPPSLVGVSSGGEVTKAYLRRGRTSGEVIALCEEIDAGLLVVGSRGLGTVRRILMGSQSEEISSDMHPTRGTRIHPKGLQSPLEGPDTPQRHRANKGSICGENAPSLLKASLLFEHGKRLVEASAWKVCSANFALTQF
jgi:Universal stress protein family